jgi:hypothetical protein
VLVWHVYDMYEGVGTFSWSRSVSVTPPPLLPPVLGLRRGRGATGVSGPSTHRFFSAAGVSRASPSSLSLRDMDSTPSSFLREKTCGGDGVETCAEDGAVVPDEADGTLRPGLPGVESADVREPSDSSG